VSGAVKHDGAKPELALMSSAALNGLGIVLTYGAKKYAADNWRLGMRWRRLISAGLRHLLAFSDGEDIDPESGLPHLDHAACCLHFLSEYQKKHRGEDDRHVHVQHLPSKARKPRVRAATRKTKTAVQSLSRSRVAALPRQASKVQRARLSKVRRA
jgi:hypothetical protein